MKKIIILLILPSLCLLSGCEGFIDFISGPGTSYKILFCENYTTVAGCNENHEEFNSSVKSVKASMIYKNAKKTNVFLTEWWYLDENIKVANPSFKQNKEGMIALKFNLDNKDKAWKIGEYEVRVYRDDDLKPIATGKFRIKK